MSHRHGFGSPTGTATDSPSRKNESSAAISPNVALGYAMKFRTSTSARSTVMALHLGLTNRVSDDDRCLDEALALAEAISKNGPRAIRHALSVIRQSRNLSLDKTLELELEEAVTLVESGESVHGVTAFLEKREADFPDIE